jgi:hypothetical protein
MERKVLHTIEYLVGYLPEIDNSKLKANILNSYNSQKFMSEESSDIRYEDIRLEILPEVKKLTKLLIDKFSEAYGLKIKLVPTEDINQVIWAVIHGKNESTNWHGHESSHNYENGAKISAVYYVDVPENSGDIIFKINENPYTTKQYLEKSETSKFILFDSTIQHCVTKNLSENKRFIISMNFTFDE